MRPVRVRAKLAARIAGLGGSVLADSITHGHLACVPPTRSGSARLFEEHHLIGLCIYSLLLEDGLMPRQAGQVACEVQELARTFPTETHVLWVCGSLTSRIFAREGADFERLMTDLTNPHFPLFVGESIKRFTVFPLDTYRVRIARAIEDELSIVGQDDGSD